MNFTKLVTPAVMNTREYRRFVLRDDLAVIPNNLPTAVCVLCRGKGCESCNEVGYLLVCTVSHEAKRAADLARLIDSLGWLRHE